jgi:hypothetical protein
MHELTDQIIFLMQIFWRDVDARQKLKIYLAYEMVRPLPIFLTFLPLNGPMIGY